MLIGSIKLFKKIFFHARVFRTHFTRRLECASAFGPCSWHAAATLPTGQRETKCKTYIWYDSIENLHIWKFQKFCEIFFYFWL